MTSPIEKIINRQQAITEGTFDFQEVNVPKYSTYAVCNLRGGVGKTTLTFNLSYYASDVLVVDVCPQGNLSYFFDKDYDKRNPNAYDMLLPYLVPGLGPANHVAAYVGATNSSFDGRKTYYIPSSNEFYLAPSALNSALNLTQNLPAKNRADGIARVLFSLKKEIEREKKELGLAKTLIDTSPFFSGGTELAWHASEGLIVPIRTDRQSINSFELLIRTLTDPSLGFLRYREQVEGFRIPKIHAVVLTHCGWSTKKDARSVPNQQTKIYLQQCYDILSRNRSLLSSDVPEDHLFLLDDLLGSGRVSSLKSRPIELLKSGEAAYYERVRAYVNQSVEKCKQELRFINALLWN